MPHKMAKMARFVRYSAQKVPLSTDGRAASSTNPATWTTYEEARKSTAGVGIGFVLGEGIGCLDLDHCFSDGKLQPWAAEVVEANRGTWMEVSRSGDGLHIFGLTDAAPGRKHRNDGRNIEVYSQGRYIALTLNTFEHAPTTLRPLQIPPGR